MNLVVVTEEFGMNLAVVTEKFGINLAVWNKKCNFAENLRR